MRYARRHQLSRHQSDTKDTEGDFATAWLDHGTAPRGAGYEYAVRVRTTPEAMQAFATAMADPNTAPYQVLRKDARAHIVRDRQTRTWGCVLFEAQSVSPELPVKAVDHSCLLMLEETTDGLHLSLADPAVNLVNHVSQPRPLRVTLRGAWQVRSAPAGVRVVDRPGGDTRLEFVCHQGRSFDVELIRGQ